MQPRFPASSRRIAERRSLAATSSLATELRHDSAYQNRLHRRGPGRAPGRRLRTIAPQTAPRRGPNGQRTCRQSASRAQGPTRRTAARRRPNRRPPPRPHRTKTARTTRPRTAQRPRQQSTESSRVHVGLHPQSRHRPEQPKANAELSSRHPNTHHRHRSAFCATPAVTQNRSAAATDICTSRTRSFGTTIVNPPSW